MSFIAWMQSAKLNLRAFPFSFRLRNRSCLFMLLIACLLFLSFVSTAENPAPQFDEGAYPKQEISPETAKYLRAASLAKRMRNSFSSYNSQFEQMPKQMDMFKLEQLQHQAAENRERSRKRLIIPNQAMADQEVLETSAVEAKRIEAANLATAAESRAYDRFNKGFFEMLLLIVAGLFLLRKLKPEFNEWIKTNLNPWMMKHTLEIETSPIPLEEEKSFLEFQAKFCAASAGGKVSAHLDGGEVEAGIFSSARHQIDRIQKLVQEARLSTVEMTQRKILRGAYEKLQSLKTLLINPELLLLEEMATALELLVKQLTEKSGTITSSTLRTVTQGLEVLLELCNPELKRDLLAVTQLRFLVVDDEMFSRYALSLALKRTLSEPDVAETVEQALHFAGKNLYDLIFLDIGMPGMDGFELCTKIRETTQNKSAPVVFVTSLRDFDTRAKSIICGARDLISKPFLTFELTVKALTLVTRERLKGRGIATKEETENKRNETALPVALQETLRPIIKESETKVSVPATVVPELHIANAVSLSKPAQVFLAQAGAQVAAMLELLNVILEIPNFKVQQEMMSDLYLRVHSFAVGAEACQQQSLSQIGHAVEGLLKKLINKKRELNVSTLETVSKALCLIQELCVGDPDRGGTISAPIGVLAVDDDPIARRFMTNALQLKFVSPQSAVDGKTAVELAAKQCFDVIFLDVQMPDIDGFDVCKQIRENSANLHTPVVFVTSHYDSEVKAQAFACNGNDFISKPYICSELALKTITLAFGNRLANANAQSIEAANAAL